VLCWLLCHHDRGVEMIEDASRSQPRQCHIYHLLLPFAMLGWNDNRKERGSWIVEPIPSCDNGDFSF
jgi:hypothetical protein